MTQLNPLTPSILDELRSQVPAAAFRPIAPHYVEEPRGLWKGRAGAILAPGSVHEAAAILRVANNRRVGVVPYSGGTGLVSGQIAPDLPEPIILSTERMCSIRGVFRQENVMLAEAGVILRTAREAAESQDRLFPLMIASEGSARLGGNLSTNAGGMNVLRYGNARDLCLGVEAVLADGTIIQGLKRLRKDNTGYDIKNLLIGAEGTLGLITAASLRLFPRPDETMTALLQVSDPESALSLLSLAGDYFAESVSLFELISGTAFDFLSETMAEVRLPFDHRPEWMVLVEVGAQKSSRIAEGFESFFQAAVEKELVSDGVLAQNSAQSEGLIRFRESIPAANRRVGAISSHDISLPLGSLPEFIRVASVRIASVGPFRINCFGHLGDGNLHFNLYPPKGEDRSGWLKQREMLEHLVYDLVAEFEGSFSAEHGVGRLKVPDLERYGDPGRMEAMRRIKSALDPNGIMNPGVILSDR